MRESHRALLYFAAGVTSVGVASALHTLYKPVPIEPETIKAPTELLKDVTPEDLRHLPYPPQDFIPGARDVSTPYGIIRLYEWGPTDAIRKVVLLHGISGSCVVLLTLAETLAANGCRVMILDLFGRGWSGGPADLPYDGRLYASQIFMSLASSPLAWTGSLNGDEAQKPRISIIGYSLGGGIAADFASYFPDLIEDLVLIAPGGLMKSDWRSRMLYSGLVPEDRMKRILRHRLLGHVSEGALEPGLTREESAGQAPQVETFLERVKDIDADAVVGWQLDHNPGFVPAFVSSIRYAPTKYQHDRWRRIGESIRARSTPRDTVRFSNGNVLLILGGQDSIITPAKTVPDARETLGEEELEVKVFEDADHSVTMSHGADIADMLLVRWQNTVLSLNSR